MTVNGGISISGLNGITAAIYNAAGTMVASVSEDGFTSVVTITNLENAYSFNISSGDKHEEGSSFTLRVYPNAYYRFEGWKLNGKIVNTTTSFTYTMPSAETTIEALFIELPYDPEKPIGPPSSGSK